MPRSQHGKVVSAALMTLVGAAGAGMLLAGLTMQPLAPPQPAAEAPAVMAAPTTVTAAEVPPSLAPALARAEPVKIHIPAIGVNADLIAGGVTPSNELELPDVIKQPMLATWYKFGPSPGEHGNAVIAGHVDSEKIGPAVFFNLGKLKRGDEVNVTRKDGTVARFTVDSVSSVPKSRFPLEVVYAPSDTAQLKIITCGGKLDRKNKTYSNNIIASATLNT